MKTTSKWRQPQFKDEIEYKDDLKYKDKTKYEKYEDKLKYTKPDQILGTKSTKSKLPN